MKRFAQWRLTRAAILWQEHVSGECLNCDDDRPCLWLWCINARCDFWRKWVAR
jgi:hypothetical protein